MHRGIVPALSDHGFAQKGRSMLLEASNDGHRGEPAVVGDSLYLISWLSLGTAD
jgi:hypothetical protein